MPNRCESSADHAYREVSLNQGQALQGLQARLDSLTQGVSNMHLEMRNSVRQLHLDTTASHQALAKFEKNTDETTSLLTTSHKDTLSFREDLSEMKTMLAALMSCDGRAILPKLVSKPDALRKISDMAGSGSPNHDPDLPAKYHSEQILSSRVYPELRCTCNPRRVSKGWRRRIGLSFMEQERIIDNIHGPRCPFACLNVQSNDKWSFSISSKALKRILHAGLKISISATSGAGGFGLSPSFTYFPVRENSPVRRVVNLLRAAFIQRLWSDEESDHLFRRGIETLQFTMTARKWSPFDIDGEGAGVLGDMFMELECNWQGNRIKMVDFFLSLGAPRDRPDDYGKYVFQMLLRLQLTEFHYSFPFHDYMNCVNNQQEYAEAFDLLWADEVPLLRHGRQLTSRKYPNVGKMQNYKAAAGISANMRNRKFAAGSCSPGWDDGR